MLASVRFRMAPVDVEERELLHGLRERADALFRSGASSFWRTRSPRAEHPRKGERRLQRIHMPGIGRKSTISIEPPGIMK